MGTSAHSFKSLNQPVIIIITKRNYTALHLQLSALQNTCSTETHHNPSPPPPLPSPPLNTHTCAHAQHTHVRVRAYTHTCMHMHTHRQTDTHTHTLTHTSYTPHHKTDTCANTHTHHNHTHTHIHHTHTTYTPHTYRRDRFIFLSLTDCMWSLRTLSPTVDDHRSPNRSVFSGQFRKGMQNQESWSI